MVGWKWKMNEQIDQGKAQTKKPNYLIDILISGAILCLMFMYINHNLFRYLARGVPGQIEAKKNLAAIYTAYQAYHSNYNTYPSSPSTQIDDTVYNCLSVAGWRPKGTIRNNYNCMNTEAFSPAANDSPCPLGIITSATKDSFTIAACGNVDNDTTVDVWTINDAKHLRNVVDDVKN
jgi:hypothetical protein